MYTSTIVAMLALATTSLAGPIHMSLSPRQEIPCFLVGNTALPAEVAAIAAQLRDVITCDSSIATISGVPDVKSGSTNFASISFAKSTSTPLDFALSEFATATPLASTDLAKFQDELNVYIATEAGIRSTGGGLAIKVPKFFLAFQVARIKTAQGVAITDPGQTVDHLLGKVLKNAPKESKASLAKVSALATTLK